jgi:hypothetical protein
VLLAPEETVLDPPGQISQLVAFVTNEYLPWVHAGHVDTSLWVEPGHVLPTRSPAWQSRHCVHSELSMKKCSVHSWQTESLASEHVVCSQLAKAAHGSQVPVAVLNQ